MKRKLAEMKKFVRQFAKVSGSNYPIVVVLGNKSPTLVGKSWHHVNKSGDEIMHPSAYRRAYGNPIYVPSTMRIEVGYSWLNRRFDKTVIDCL